MTLEIDKTIYLRPVELLQNLIRFDTSNPPGNEGECIHYIARLLNEAGIETQLFSKDPNRPNLVARLKGKDNEKPPMLIYGHVDVVPASEGNWTHPPFSGEIDNGFVWGRGALDMKGAVSMMVCAFMKAKIENAELPSDVILCLLCDEEEFGEYGAKFMVENHPDLFKGVRYALSEFGAFTLYAGGKKFYPIEVAQKQKCLIKAVLRGPSGHGSSYIKGGAMAKLAEMLTQLDKNRLRVHITPAAEKMFKAMAKELSFPNSLFLRLLLKPLFTDFVLRIMGEKGKAFIPMFRNTANATVVRGGNKVNVIPSEIEVQFDVRLLPGFTPDDAIKELRPIIGSEVELETLLYDAGPNDIDMSLFDTLSNILKKSDPEGIPIPMILTGCSDARFFSRLGIRTYGFTPMQLPENMNFSSTIHSTNERIPTNTLDFGMNGFYMLITRGLF
jgi:acetylornithine deacetylase/succinyl-diaminopimelate desuccinylase-like protein